MDEVKDQVMQMLAAAHPRWVREEDILDELGMYSMEDVLPAIDALIGEGRLNRQDKGNDKSYQLKK